MCCIPPHCPCPACCIASPGLGSVVLPQVCRIPGPPPGLVVSSSAQTFHFPLSVSSTRALGDLRNVAKTFESIRYNEQWDMDRRAADPSLERLSFLFSAYRCVCV